MNHATVSMSMSYLSPDYSDFIFQLSNLFLKIEVENSDFVRFSDQELLCSLLSIHSTSLSYIEFNFILRIYTFNFQKSCVLPLVPETPLIASKNGLRPQPSRHTVILEVLFPAGFCRLQDGRKSLSVYFGCPSVPQTLCYL